VVAPLPASDMTVPGRKALCAETATRASQRTYPFPCGAWMPKASYWLRCRHRVPVFRGIGARTRTSSAPVTGRRDHVARRVPKASRRCRGVTGVRADVAAGSRRSPVFHWLRDNRMAFETVLAEDGLRNGENSVS
jgi:hypothetical protein